MAGLTSITALIDGLSHQFLCLNVEYIFVIYMKLGSCQGLLTCVHVNCVMASHKQTADLFFQCFSVNFVQYCLLYSISANTRNHPIINLFDLTFVSVGSTQFTLNF